MDVKEEFLTILQDYVDFPVDEIPTDDAFKSASGVDSFMLIEIISAIEDKFKISIPNADLNHFRSIDDIIRYIEMRLSPAIA